MKNKSKRVLASYAGFFEWNLVTSGKRNFRKYSIEFLFVISLKEFSSCFVGFSVRLKTG